MEQRSVIIQNQQFEKDKEATLDFEFDWTPWLQTAETISSAQLTIETGMTITNTVTGAKTVIAWLSGGTAGTWYSVTCKITTSAGRVDRRTIQILASSR